MNIFRTKALASAIALAVLSLQACSTADKTAGGEKHHASKGPAAQDQKLNEIKKEANAGPFKPNWDSLATYQIPEWYKDAKFGIFIHWGVYSVPAFNGEWYPRWMYAKGDAKGNEYYQHHLETYGPVDQFGYKDFIPMFKAEKFDAKQWAKVFKDAGARYVIPVAEHHDGFPMYDSDYTDWDAAQMGPKRDVIAELKTAIRNEGLHFGLSSHRAENWWFFGEGRKIKSDVQDDRYRGLYGAAQDRTASEDGTTPPDKAFLDDWLLRTVEIVDKYQPDIIWFDWWMATEPFHQHLKEFSAYYYNKGSRQKDMVAINYKKFGGESYPDTAGVLDIERGQLAEIRKLYWQTDTSVSKNSWGYVTNHKYKTAGSLVDDLIDIVSKNGCMLLNIGPRPDGTIPEQEVQMLKDMGAWLSINAEAIYDTRPWVTFGEGVTEVIDGTMMNDAEHHRKDFTAQDIRFTQHNNDVYAIMMAWPGDNKTVTIKSLSKKNYAKTIKQVSMLGSKQAISWKQTDAGLVVELPSTAPHEFAQTLKVSF